MRTVLAVCVALAASTGMSQTGVSQGGVLDTEAAERPALVVLDIETKGSTALEAEAVTTGLVRGARELDAFQVLSAEDVRQLLALDRQKQLLGTQEDNLTSYEAGLGARHAVAGSLVKVGENFDLEVRLLDTKSGKVAAQRSLTRVMGFDKLVPQVSALAQQLLGTLLQGEQGTLLVRSSEEGAEVLVDDQLIGSTPMNAALSLPRGKHRLVVRKEGFVARSGLVRVTRAQLTVEEVALVPSKDFANAYAKRNSRMRLGAVVTSAVAALAIGSAVGVDRLVSQPTFDNEFAPRIRVLSTALKSSDSLAAFQSTNAIEEGCATDLAACRDRASSLQQSLKNQQMLSLGLAGVGVVCAGLSAYFWLSGDDPGRYGKVFLVGGPTPSGGGAMALSGSF